MESLDLNGLAKSLPVSNFEKAEKDLLNNFKAAALSITTLYRSSRNASKRAYNAGYAAACQDLMVMIQHGVSAGGISPSASDDPHSGEMSIGRIMDWIEARIEAIKAREEEEDEDEEPEKERQRPNTAPTTSSRTDVHKDNNVSVSFASIAPHKQALAAYKLVDETTAHAPLTPHSPSSLNSMGLTQVPSSSPAFSARSLPHAPLPQRPIKVRPSCPRKDTTDAAPPTSPPIPHATSENVIRTPISTIPLEDVSAGAKRRHAVMMMFDSPPSAAIVDVSPSPSSSTMSHSFSTPGNPRRRTRSQRSANHPQGQTLSSDSMEMDVDGRERKRMSRR